MAFGEEDEADIEDNGDDLARRNRRNPSFVIGSQYSGYGHCERSEAISTGGSG